MLTVRDHRTGLPVRVESWADWRSRWERRPLGLRQRVRLCSACWGFGALVVIGAGALGVPCIACGRTGQDVPAAHHTPDTCPTCGGRL
ncbi:MAG: hypothetical protein RIB67_07565 [Miltoncostaeaceae bacterium]